MDNDKSRLIPERPQGSKQDKWVTFEDLVDDAMEGGSLSPISMGNAKYSMTTNDLTAALQSMKNQRRSSFANFSSPSALAPPRSEDGSSESGDSHHGQQLPKPPTGRVKTRRDRIHSDGSEGKVAVRQSFSGAIPQYSNSKDSLEDSNVDSSRSKVMDKVATTARTEDKYSALFELKPARGKGYTGWSSTIMGNGSFGWSDEILFFPEGTSPGSGSEDGWSVSNEDNDDHHHRFIPNVNGVEDPWPRGSVEDAPLRRGSWNTSPSRRFVRNFP